MHKITFHNLGNADSYRIDLENGKKLLFDYAATRDPEDKDDKRCDLEAELRADLNKANRDFFEVVAFTHIDNDHIKGASDFFWLEHAKKYQGDDRIKINELWVPAAAIIEKGVDGEKAIVQREARYRLKEGRRIRVFSRPERLKDWLEEQGLSLDDRKHLITDAGSLVPGFTLEGDDLEFFVHSPFAHRQDGELIDRNEQCIVLQAKFKHGDRKTRFFMAADTKHENLDEIVTTTEKHNREDRLEWDVMKIPHHCSYLSLGPDKGKEKTEPTENIKRLYEEYGQTRGVLVSSSDPIPDEDTDQPPHRQAARYYEDVADMHSGEFMVTMEHPSSSAPKPIVIRIGDRGATIEKRTTAGVAAVITRPSPRAGA
ncbi:MAG: hypothetical protein IH899_13485 [Planctomycetes bacterium]|nr:hypothetical protein [Planctomycetota bacterium]